MDKWLSGVKTGPAALEYNGRMLDSYQKAIETSGAMKQESALLFKGLRGPKLTKAMEDYFGGTASMRVKGGNFANTFMNTGTRSLFERAAYHALGGIDNFSEELSKAERLFALAQAGDKTEFEKLLAESGKDMDDRFNTTLIALSRAFVPTGLRGKLNTSQAGDLSYTTIKLLDDYLKLEKRDPKTFKGS